MQRQYTLFMKLFPVTIFSEKVLFSAFFCIHLTRLKGCSLCPYLKHTASHCSGSGLLFNVWLQFS